MSTWYRGGPKRNGGRFGFIHGGRLSMGSNHRPISKVGRVRMMAIHDLAMRKPFGRRSLVQMFLQKAIR